MAVFLSGNMQKIGLFLWLKKMEKNEKNSKKYLTFSR